LKRVVWLVACLWVSGAAVDASAQSTEDANVDQEGPEQSEDEARMHFRLGRAYYDSGRFPEAAREFEQAAELSDRPGLYYNIFLAYRDAGDLANAIRALETYLDRVPDIAERAQLEARLESMRRLVDESETAEPPEPVDPPDDPDPIEPDEPDEPMTTPVATERQLWMPGFGIAAAGGALLVGSLVTGVLALTTESDLESRCSEGADGTWACPEGAQADADRGRTLALLSDVFLGVGAAAAAAGVVLAFVLADDVPADRARASVACLPGSCFGSLTVPLR